MKLTYTAVAASLLSVLSYSATAADLDIYGKANVSIQSSDEVIEVSSNASRLGFKGTQKLENGLEVVFKAEFQTDLDGDSDSNFKSRNQYIGLKSDFGTVLIGNNDSMLKQSQGKVDIFGDLKGDIKTLWKGENRVSNSVTYASPSFAGFKAGLTYAASEVDGEDAGISAVVTYGDAKLKKSSVYAAVAVDKDVKGYDVTRVTAQTKLAGVTFGGMYQTQEKIEDGTKLDGLMASAKYKVSGFDLKAQVQTADEENGASKLSYTLGTDYKLAKNVKAFGFFTAIDNDTAGEDASYFGTGLEYKF